MDYPLGPGNWFCATFGHRYGRPYSGYTLNGVYVPTGVTRRTCKLDGKTIPPLLPDDQQPEGAI